MPGASAALLGRKIGPPIDRCWRGAIVPFRARRPERWIYGVAAAGWLVLGTMSLWAGVVTSPGAPHSMAGHSSTSGHAGMAIGRAGQASGADVGTGILLAAAMWAAMVAATMLPLQAANLRFVGRRSPRSRLVRAGVDVAAGWAAVWLVTGAAILAGSALLHAALGEAPAVALVFALAIAWQCSRRKQLAVASCHRRFAPPAGPAAAARCRRYGADLGRACATSCWALMAAMAVAGHRLAAVVPLAWVSWFERGRTPTPSTRAVSVGVIATTAILTIGAVHA